MTSAVQADDAARIPVTILGPPDYPPYSYLDGVEQKGLYIEIFRVLFSRLDGYDVNIQMMPWKRSLAQIEAGEYLAVYPPYYWPEQRPWMIPYSEPILLERTAVYCREDVLSARSRDTWPSDYFGLTIGVDLGSLSPGPAFFEAVEAGKIMLQETTLASSAGMILHGRLDCYVQDPKVLRFHYEEYAVKHRTGKPFNTVFHLGTVITDHFSYLGYTAADAGKFPFKDDFVQKVNAILKKMKGNGEIDQIIEAFFQGKS